MAVEAVGLFVILTLTICDRHQELSGEIELGVNYTLDRLILLADPTTKW